MNLFTKDKQLIDIRNKHGYWQGQGQGDKLGACYSIYKIDKHKDLLYNWSL